MEGRGAWEKHTLLYPSLLALIDEKLLELRLVFVCELGEVDVLVELGAWLIHFCLFCCLVLEVWGGIVVALVGLEAVYILTNYGPA